MNLNFISTIPKNNIIIIYGATATGKSKIALKIASKINGTIINADSMQIYKEIPILTAQPNNKDLKSIPHKLYGIISCRKKKSVVEWLKLARKEIKRSIKKKKNTNCSGGYWLLFKKSILWHNQNTKNITKNIYRNKKFNL